MLKADAHEAEIVKAGGFPEMQGAASSTGWDIESLKATYKEADTHIILHVLDDSKMF